MRDEHAEGVCAAPVCVNCAGLTGGEGRTAEKRESERVQTHANTHMHTHTHTHYLATYVLHPRSWAERWSQFVQCPEWEVEEQLQ